MTFKPENTLERSLVKAVEDPGHRPQFLKDFTASDILIVQNRPPPGPGSTRTADEEIQLEIQQIEFEGHRKPLDRSDVSI